MANGRDSLNLTNRLEENLKQKERKRNSCLGLTYSVQAGGNNLFSLCFWSLPRNRNRILFAYLCYFSYYCFLFQPSSDKTFFSLCVGRPQTLQCRFGLSAAPAQILTIAHPCWTEQISLLFFLHSSSTAWHQTWLPLWPIKCHFMDRWVFRSWITLQSSDPRSKEGFSIHQTISGAGMPQAFSCWSLGQLLEKYLPVPALFWLSRDSFTTQQQDFQLYFQTFGLTVKIIN